MSKVTQGWVGHIRYHGEESFLSTLGNGSTGYTGHTVYT